MQVLIRGNIYSFRKKTLLKVKLGQDMTPRVGAIRSGSGKLMVGLFENTLEAAIAFPFEDKKRPVVLVKTLHLLVVPVIRNAHYLSFNGGNSHVGLTKSVEVIDLPVERSNGGGLC